MNKSVGDVNERHHLCGKIFTMAIDYKLQIQIAKIGPSLSLKCLNFYASIYGTLTVLVTVMLYWHILELANKEGIVHK